MRRAVHIAEPRAREIAVLADAELVAALRLAGVARTRALRAVPAAREAVLESLETWLADDTVALVIIGAGHAALVRERLEAFRRGRRAMPVVVEVPSRDGPWEADAAQYYARMGRDYLGLELALEKEAGNGAANGARQGAREG